MIPSPLVCGVCASNLALIFEVCVPQTIRMSDKHRAPVTSSTTAAGKIMPAPRKGARGRKKAKKHKKRPLYDRPTRHIT